MLHHKVTKKRDKRVNYGVCKANFVLAQKEAECVSYVSKMWPKCAKNIGDQRYIGTLVLCFMPLLYSLLHIIYAPQSPCAT